MSKIFLSVASGAVLCCAAVAYFASPLAKTDATIAAAWVAVVLCHVLAGFFAIGGGTALRAGSRSGVVLCAGLAAAWTVVQALTAALMIALLSLAMTAETARTVLVAATIVMAGLSFFAIRSGNSGRNGA